MSPFSEENPLTGLFYLPLFTGAWVVIYLGFLAAVWGLAAAPEPVHSGMVVGQEHELFPARPPHSGHAASVFEAGLSLARTGQEESLMGLPGLVAFDHAKKSPGLADPILTRHVLSKAWYLLRR